MDGTQAEKAPKMGFVSQMVNPIRLAFLSRFKEKWLSSDYVYFMNLLLVSLGLFSMLGIAVN